MVQIQLQLNLGGTITFSGISNEVDVSESSGTVTVGLINDVTIGQDLTVTRNATITGNLTVNGTTTTVATTNTTISDSLLELNSGGFGSSMLTILVLSSKEVVLVTMELFSCGMKVVDRFALGTTTATADATGNITIADSLN